jgi:hypothetical protein
MGKCANLYKTENETPAVSSRVEIESAIGESFPVEYLFDLSNTALLIVYDWLQTNNAPEEIQRILGIGHTLQNECYYRTTPTSVGTTNKMDHIPSYVTDLIRAIYQSGHNLSVEP